MAARDLLSQLFIVLACIGMVAAEREPVPPGNDRFKLLEVDP